MIIDISDSEFKNILSDEKLYSPCAYASTNKFYIFCKTEVKNEVNNLRRFLQKERRERFFN